MQSVKNLVGLRPSPLFLRPGAYQINTICHFTIFSAQITTICHKNAAIGIFTEMVMANHFMAWQLLQFMAFIWTAFCYFLIFLFEQIMAMVCHLPFFKMAFIWIGPRPFGFISLWWECGVRIIFKITKCVTNFAKCIAASKRLATIIEVINLAKKVEGVEFDFSVVL